ncbi:hypothetical protein D3Z48_14255, partial [Clostridiaceae bacterium]|nr:hypothetical protein [Clostridiaceae bacterium]
YISDQIGEHTEQSGLFCDFQPLIRISNMYPGFRPQLPTISDISDFAPFSDSIKGYAQSTVTGILLMFLGNSFMLLGGQYVVTLENVPIRIKPDCRPFSLSTSI